MSEMTSSRQTWGKPWEDIVAEIEAIYEDEAPPIVLNNLEVPIREIAAARVAEAADEIEGLVKENDALKADKERLRGALRNYEYRLDYAIRDLVRVRATKKTQRFFDEAGPAIEKVWRDMQAYWGKEGGDADG